MGYTRYWKRTDKEITEEFIAEVNEILEECKAHGIIIKDGWGEHEPIVSLDEIEINGNAETGLDHESFYLGNEKSDFEFCKTARKPYDFAVREILNVAEKYGLVTNVRCDGANNEIISDEEYLNG